MADRLVSAYPLSPQIQLFPFKYIDTKERPPT